MRKPDAPWWRDAVVYQVYIRSFVDSDGDGVGDIKGIERRLAYLHDLGVDAIWINPWYPSPMVDAGYDVADYRGIEPVFGTLDDATALIVAAHAMNLKVLLDIVPNHSSDQHPFFRAALAAAPGSPERARYYFRDGRGSNGEQPPNDWRSVFGGAAWTRIHEPDGRPGQWYLHLFAPAQPDFDWTNTDVQHEFDDTLAFWFDRGVDGFRIDVAHGLAKSVGLPDVGDLVYPDPQMVSDQPHPHWDVAQVHDIYRRWRAIADQYPGDRIFVAEAWTGDPVSLARYIRPDELHTAFNFDFLLAPWLAPQLRSTIEATMAAHEEVGAPPTWVLSNHDVLREVSRYARPQGARSIRHLDDAAGLPIDFERGRRRARAAALLMLALPGGAYIYQGGELGLPEVEDLPDDALRDPIWEQSGRTLRGRDGCRVPIPWTGRSAPFGFSPPDASVPPWLPMPAMFQQYTAESQDADESSSLALYRTALRIRRELPGLGDGAMTWAESPSDVLSFVRGASFGCIVNFGEAPYPLPKSVQVLVASERLLHLPPGGGGLALPTDVGVWYRR
ncbi:MAG TPA: glycoside hydrolase family 13 protein [Acidothermaceae bacterium]